MVSGGLATGLALPALVAEGDFTLNAGNGKTADLLLVTTQPGGADYSQLMVSIVLDAI